MREQLTETLEAYSKAGFHLFPINPKSKLPMLKGYRDKATTDMSQLMMWAMEFPGCNWGMDCEKSGVVAVDIDWNHNGMEVWEGMIAKDGEPETLKATTGSGGKHYVFKAKKGKSYKGKIRKGIDIKHKGYIVVFPSLNIKYDERYRWDNWWTEPNDAPKWIQDLIERKPKKKGEKNITYKLGDEYLDQLVEKLKTVELNYEEWINCGMAIHHAEPNERGQELWFALTQGINYQDGDIEWAEQKWESFHDMEEGTGVTFKTLSFMVRKKGLTLPSPYFGEDLKKFQEEQNKLEMKRLTDEKEDAEGRGFVELDDHFEIWSKDELVSEFHRMGFAFRSHPRTPFCLITENPNGPIEVKSMGRETLMNETAPYYYATIKHTNDGPKKIVEPAWSVWNHHKNRRNLGEIVFKPEDKIRSGEFNLFDPKTYWDSMPKGDGKEPVMLLRMINESLCCGDTSAANWLLDWLAHILQKPFEKCATVPVLISEQGAGKGLLMDNVMAPILRDYFTAVMTAKELMSQFNVKLSGKFLTFVDEATWRGNKTEDGILKRLIGSPTMTVEEKFGRQYNIQNYSRYLIASNNDEAVAVEKGNRRYAIIEASSELANDLAFFKPIVKEVNTGREIGRFSDYLMERNIEDFNPFLIYEDGKSGVTAKITSQGIVGEFWFDLFFENPKAIWSEENELEHHMVFRFFEEFVKGAKAYERNLTPQKFWRITNKIVPGLGEKSRKRTEGVPLWVRRCTPSNAMESFCDTLKIEKPKFFSNEDFIEKDEFKQDFLN